MAPESLTRLRVLVVDDEKRLTELLRLELDVEGYDVDVEQDGAGGLIRSRTDPTPDLVILDWNLPDFSGIDICQRMRAGGVTIPILMLTGHDEITDRVKALDAGVDDYLIKPFSIDELIFGCAPCTDARKPSPEPAAVLRLSKPSRSPTSP